MLAGTGGGWKPSGRVHRYSASIAKADRAQRRIAARIWARYDFGRFEPYAVTRDLRALNTASI